METSNLVLAGDFCMHHHISYTFIAGLRDAGLIELTVVGEDQFLHTDQLHELEKLIRLHTELDINPEGVEAIAHLLHKLHSLQHELQVTKQRLRVYENNW